MERLPMPVDVGKALVVYLVVDDRDDVSCGVRAGQWTAAACRRRTCGCRAPSLHAGRHHGGESPSAAPQRGHGDAPSGRLLEEVGQVLRDRDAQVVALYAKVDFVALRPRPCPGPVMRHDHPGASSTITSAGAGRWASSWPRTGRLLPDFVAYLEAAGASTVTTELAVAWATQPTDCTPVWWARRLAMVRLCPPPQGHRPGHRGSHWACCPTGAAGHPVFVLRRRRRRVDGRGRRCCAPLRAATYETVVGYWPSPACAGEARRLDRDHLDWDEGVLTVWNSKFQKRRALPFTPRP